MPPAPPPPPPPPGRVVALPNRSTCSRLFRSPTTPATVASATECSPADVKEHRQLHTGRHLDSHEGGAARGVEEAARNQGALALGGGSPAVVGSASHACAQPARRAAASGLCANPASAPPPLPPLEQAACAIEVSIDEQLRRMTRLARQQARLQKAAAARRSRGLRPALPSWLHLTSLGEPRNGGLFHTGWMAGIGRV